MIRSPTTAPAALIPIGIGLRASFVRQGEHKGSGNPGSGSAPHTLHALLQPGFPPEPVAE
ncbi:MAG TPA: hypothetical protein VN939_13950 [Chthoniobacterales bacterium]|nr:hypothetical protein [Chthoniobacterales bacterium]